MSNAFQLDEAEMQALAGQFAKAMPGALCVHLLGDLGAGKTTLARAWLRALGHDGPVRSPTYSLVEPYQLPTGRAYHLDLYRLAEPEELEYLGRDEWDDDDVLLLIEWPQRGGELTPPADAIIRLQSLDNGERRELTVDAISERGRTWLDQIRDR